MHVLFTTIKKRKALILIPVFIIVVFIPLMCRHYTLRYADDPDEMLKNTLTLLHTCIPMLISWWIILLYQDFFSWEGNELLYYYYPQPKLLSLYGAALFAYGLMEAGVFAAVRHIIDLPLFVLGQLAAETLFVAALTYFFAFLLLNTGGSLLVSIGYCVYLNMFDTLNLFGFMSIFPRPEQFLIWDGARVKHTLIIAVILDIAGMICMKYRRKYK